jgi:hypothetical protein
LITDVDREKIPETDVPEFPQTDSGQPPSDAGDAGADPQAEPGDTGSTADASG